MEAMCMCMVVKHDHQKMNLLSLFCLVVVVVFCTSSPVKYQRLIRDGNKHFTASALAAASDSFRQAISMEPDTRQGWIGLASVLNAQGDIAGAISMYRKAIGLTDAAAGGGSSASKKKKNEEEPLPMSMNDANVQMQIAILSYSAGSFADAAAAAEAAIKLDSTLAHAYFLAGISRVNAGGKTALTEAEKYLRLAMQLERQQTKQVQQLSQYMYALSVCLDRLGKYDASLATFSELVQVDPKNVKAFNYLGDMLSRTGRHLDAERAYAMVSQLEPTSSSSMVNVGNAQRRQGKYKTAMKAYKQSLRLDPRNAEAYYYMGMTMDATKEPSLSEKYYAMAVQCDPKHPSALNNLAGIYSSKRDYNTAVSLYERAIQAKENFWEAYASIGSSLKSAGRLKEAIHAMTYALTLDNSEPQLHFVLGMALKEIGDIDAAISRIRIALSMRDWDKDYYFELARLYYYRGELPMSIAILSACQLSLGKNAVKAENRWKKFGANNALEYADILGPKVREYLKTDNEYSSSITSMLSSLSAPSSSFKGVIVYLCCGNDEEFEEMQWSLRLLWKNFNRHHGPYPVIIFHDNLNASAQSILQSAAAPMNVSFVEISFDFPPFLSSVDVPPYLHLAGHNWTVGYRHMSRFFSHGIYHHPVLQDADIYWRLDADSLLFDRISQDLFLEMHRNGWSYGYSTITVEAEEVVQNLWSTVKQYLKEVGKPPTSTALRHHLDSDGEWNRNMFYTNFEISKMDFWKSKEYSNFFHAIDRARGIYQHRWGDAPIHLLAITSLLNEDQIHQFTDVPYWHQYYVNLPPWVNKLMEK